jgi:hypothetical protein
MEIPVNAKVECTDGIYGRSVYVLIDPVIDQVMHLVVKADTFPNTETIVPISFVSETNFENIRLSCSRAELERMAPFIQTEFLENTEYEKDLVYGEGMYRPGSAFYAPYVTPGILIETPVEHEQIPPGEMAVRRGTRVEASDGYVGKVDEFMVNPVNGHITHLVMREGHLWGKKDVIIPLSAIAEPRQDTVFLKLDKRQVESLPTFPVNRGSLKK